MQQKLFALLIMLLLTSSMPFVSIVISDDFEPQDDYFPMDVTEIWFIDDLYAIRYNLSDDYILMKDLDFQNNDDYIDWSISKSGNTTGSGWLPIGTVASPFSGTFDGQGYTINHLFISSSLNDIGLFGVTNDSEITDLGLINANIIGTGTDPNTLHRGAVVGLAKESSITKSYATGNITSAAVVGGLVGYQYLTTINQSYANVKITCSATSVQSLLGGLIGVSYNSITEDAYARGGLTGVGGRSPSRVGGLIGHLVRDSSGPGYADKYTKNSYATGAVVGTAGSIGGLIGLIYNPTFIVCYWDKQTSGQTSAYGSTGSVGSGSGTTGKTTAEMYQQSTYSGWDFDNIWAIDEGVSYPEFLEEEIILFCPYVDSENPQNNSVNVSLSLSSISCNISDSIGALLNWSITTSPDIGDGFENGVYNKTVIVNVSGLQPLTMYTWFVNVTDGIDWANETFYFTTEDEEPLPVVVHAGGLQVQKVYQYYEDTLLRRSETEHYGGTIWAIISDINYVYVGGATTNAVYQYYKWNMTKKAEASTYGGIIYALAQDDDYIYVGGATTQTVQQYWKSNMTLKAQTAGYGGDIRAIAVDDTYVYAAGATTNTVNQYWKSNMTLNQQTANYGGIIYILAMDDTYVYAGGATTLKVYQYWKSNMTKKAETASYGGIIYALEEDNDYVYAGGATTLKVYQYWKSNMTKKAETASYGGIIYAIKDTDDYLYVGGATTDRIYQYLKSDMSKNGETGYYATQSGIIYALDVSPIDATSLYNIVYVDDDADPSWYNDTHFSSIVRAIANVERGGMVYIYNGTYTNPTTIGPYPSHNSGSANSNVIIYKNITICGESQTSVIVDAQGAQNNFCPYRAGGTITIENMYIMNWTRRGVGQYMELDPLIVKNCTVRGPEWATGAGNSISFSGNYSIIENNTIYGTQHPTSDGTGILCYSASYSIIRNNYVTNNAIAGIGIGLLSYYYSPPVYNWNLYAIDNIVENNTLLNFSTCGILVQGWVFNSTIQNNNLTNCSSGIDIESIDFGGYTKTPDGINIRSNDISDIDEDGLYVNNATNILFENNLISDCNWSGVKIFIGSDITIANNTILNNTLYGIELNDDGNLIYNNYFNNTNNAWDNSSGNIWNITKTLGTNIIGRPYIGGNYWSDYSGVDNDGDGIGNTELPYNSSGTINIGGDWAPLTDVGFGNTAPGPFFIEIPTNESIYLSVYNEYLKINCSDVDDDSLIITFYWDNDTAIAFDTIDAGNQSVIFLPDYISPDWLAHEDAPDGTRKVVQYGWYAIADDSVTTTQSATYYFTTSKAWDCNEDTYVDYLDVSNLAGVYGTSPTAGSIGPDINEDAIVDYLDVSSLAGHYGETY